MNPLELYNFLTSLIREHGAGGVAACVVGALLGALGMRWFLKGHGGAQRERLRSENEKLRGACAGLQKDKDNLHRGKDDLQLSLGKLHQQRTTLAAERERLEKERDAARRSNAGLVQQLSDLEASLDAREGELTAATSGARCIFF
jgi:hypothetical protein